VHPPTESLTASDWLRLCLVALGLAGLTAVSFVQRPDEAGFALFWPSAGIGLALAVRYGLAGLAATGLGVGLWAMLFRDWTLSAALLSAVAAMCGPAWVRWRTPGLWADGSQPFASLPSLLAILKAQAAGGSVIAALVGTAGLWWTGHWPANLPVVWVLSTYWLLETSGAWLFAPVATWLTLRQRDGKTVDRPKQLVQAALTHRVGIFFTLLLTVAVVSLLLADQSALAQAALYGLMPLLVLLALRAPPFLIHTMLMGAAALVLFTLAYLKRQPEWSGDDTLPLTLILYLLAGSGVLLVVAASMAERRRSEQRLASAALIDPLTGLGNEAALFKKLDAPMDEGQPGGRVRLLVSVCSGPLRQRHLSSGFNDLYTRDLDMSDRLRTLPHSVWWSRTGLGVFRGLWLGAAHQQSALLDGISGVCAGAHTTEGSSPWVVSGALAHYPLAQACSAQVQLGLLVQAEFRAQQFRRLEVVEISPAAVEALRNESVLAEKVRRAIEGHSLVLMAQPIVSNGCHTPTPVQPKAEILVRLRDGDGALLTPAVFMAPAMRTGLMPQLDRAVVEMTLQAMASPTSRPGARCAINLSGPTVMDDQLVSWVAHLLQRYAISAERLVFEVTESMAMTDLDSAAQTLRGLRKLGCQVAIDDFGTGMATFDYLKRFPVDSVKIDGSFIQPLVQGGGVDRVIVESMVKVAHSLGMTMVAEYVCSPELRVEVTALGIEESQGYAISEPVPLTDWLQGKHDCS
jgi:EAL domain-containing protein (putative c-di-GMP-specific phosphodiesterase class I)